MISLHYVLVVVQLRYDEFLVWSALSKIRGSISVVRLEVQLVYCRLWSSIMICYLVEFKLIEFIKQ